MTVHLVVDLDTLVFLTLSDGLLCGVWLCTTHHLGEGVTSGQYMIVFTWTESFLSPSNPSRHCLTSSSLTLASTSTSLSCLMNRY